MLEVDVYYVKKLIDEGRDFLLLDVREPWEHQRTSIEASDSELIPMMQLLSRANDLPKEKEIITYCHHGNRSLVAARFLASKGFDAKSMKGGIEEWSAKVDSNVPRYY